MRHLIILALLLTLTARAHAVGTPTGCLYPGAADNFEAVEKGQRLDHELWNRFICAINKMQAQFLASAPPISNCVNASVAPGERKAVAVTLATNSSSSKVFPTVRDTSAGGPYVEDDGIKSSVVGGQVIVNVTVFNHDPSNTRNATVCAMVLP